ncbi:MAG: hypothetical protein JNM91_12305 [Flavobacteriales bacterium]|nr:hypothetical protein [Flavobacteriales bacterium]
MGVPLGHPFTSPCCVRERLRSRFSLHSLARVLIVISICLTGCDRSIPFDKDGWQKKSDFIYPLRDAMVQDLIGNHQLMGLTTQEARDLLGETDHTELGDMPNYLTYQVLLDFGWDIDPVHTKDLVLEFNEDSIVTKVDLLEWKRQ